MSIQGSINQSIGIGLALHKFAKESIEKTQGQKKGKKAKVSNTPAGRVIAEREAQIRLEQAFADRQHSQEGINNMNNILSGMNTQGIHNKNSRIILGGSQ